MIAISYTQMVIFISALRIIVREAKNNDTTFSTLYRRVLKVYNLVTHFAPRVLIIQTVSKTKLISEKSVLGSASADLAV